MKQTGFVILSALCVILMTINSCGSSKKNVQATRSDYRNATTSEEWTFKADKKKAPEEIATESNGLIAEARKWIGTPYKYGGKNRSGTDCSGFVMQVYLMSEAIKLPRTTVDQREFCDNIKRKELRPGDLVFFSNKKSKRSVTHVGLYMGDNRIIHASTSRGVIISDLDEAYYARTYHSCGRVRNYKYREPSEPTVEAAKAPEKTQETINLYDLLDQAVDSVLTIENKTSTN